MKKSGHWFWALLLLGLGSGAPSGGADLDTPGNLLEDPGTAVVEQFERPPVEVLALPEGARLPGEFERHEGLLLAADELATRFPELLVDIVQGVGHRIQLVTLVTRAEERLLVEQLLARNGLEQRGVKCLHVPHDTMWVRDYGPLFVTGRRGLSPVVLDGDYVHLGRPNDDRVPAAVAATFRSPVVRVALHLEGGNLLSNGRGLLLTTSALLAVNHERAADERAMSGMLKRYLGAEQVVFLEPLDGEPTGHVDMFAAFTAPATVVIGSYRPHLDPANAALLDRNARRLAGLPTPYGPLKVIRLPMPPHNDGIWRTYTNGIFANGTLLVPIYPDMPPADEHRALATLSRALPGWEVVGIDTTGIIQLGGALHCISMHIPALPDAAKSPAPASKADLRPAPGPRSGPPGRSLRNLHQGHPGRLAAGGRQAR